jgi:hypothetical protein
LPPQFAQRFSDLAMAPLHALEVNHITLSCGADRGEFRSALPPAIRSVLCAANCGAPRQIGMPYCRELSVELILCNGATVAKPTQLSLAGGRNQIIVRKEMLWWSVREAHRL